MNRSLYIAICIPHCALTAEHEGPRQARGYGIQGEENPVIEVLNAQELVVHEDRDTFDLPVTVEYRVIHQERRVSLERVDLTEQVLELDPAGIYLLKPRGQVISVVIAWFIPAAEPPGGAILPESLESVFVPVDGADDVIVGPRFPVTSGSDDHLQLGDV